NDIPIQWASARQTKPQIDIAWNNDVYISRNDVSPDAIYKKEKEIGSGSFGKVYLVKNLAINGYFAEKIIKKNSNKQSEDKSIMNEITILKNLDHPKILKILDFYSTPSEYYIITEYCQLGELFNEIKKVQRFSEGHASFIMNQIFKAVGYCHGMNVIHRDLKPENIMITEREKNGCLQIKIIDFGTAKVFEKGQAENRWVGSMFYMAPEVFRQKYDEKCDWWSCGVILYIWLTGFLPFGGDNDNEIKKNIKSGIYDTESEPYPSLSKEVKDLIQQLWQVDPKKRISANDAINHQWFSTTQFKEKEKVNNISKTKAKKLINNLMNYHSDNMLRCAVIAYLVHHNTNLDQCNEASKWFNHIDINGDGKIQKHEWINGLTTYWNLTRTEIEKEVDIIFQNIDTDHNGYIEYEEFIRAAIDREYFWDKNYLKFAFNYFDKDNNGNLSLDEIKKRFLQNNKNHDQKFESQIKKTFDEIDVNHDGVISFEEFSNMMKNIIAS
ncbi:MAG: CAMK family serine/threonine-protein kinase, partial [Mycoplasma sp.]